MHLTWGPRVNCELLVKHFFGGRTESGGVLAAATGNGVTRTLLGLHSWTSKLPHTTAVTAVALLVASAAFPAAPAASPAHRRASEAFQKR